MLLQHEISPKCKIIYPYLCHIFHLMPVFCFHNALYSPKAYALYTAKNRFPAGSGSYVNISKAHISPDTHSITSVSFKMNTMIRSGTHKKPFTRAFTPLRQPDQIINTSFLHLCAFAPFLQTVLQDITLSGKWQGGTGKKNRPRFPGGGL